MPARYLPPDLWQRARHILPLDLDPALRAAIMELLAAAFDWGHMEGHERGAIEAYAPAPLVNHQRRVGTAEARVNGPVGPNGHALHPSAQPARHADEQGTVTPLRIGQIDEDIALDRFGTAQLDQAPAEQ